MHDYRMLNLDIFMAEWKPPIELVWNFLGNDESCIADLIRFSFFLLAIFVLWMLSSFLKINTHFYAVLSAGVGVVVYIANKFSSDFFHISDATPLALITFAFAGRSLSNLWRKFKIIRSASSREKSSADYERELRWALAFLTIGVILQACFRENNIRTRQSIADIKDNNACANFGGCRSGPEQLPELNAYSVLASTRFFSDMQTSGAVWKPNKNAFLNQSCDYDSLTLPMIVKSRFRVPKEKSWRYKTKALMISCNDYIVPNGLGNESVPIFTIQNQTSNKARVRIGESYMQYSISAKNVTVLQSYQEIDIVVNNKNCRPLENPISYSRCTNAEFKGIVERAVERKFLRRNQLSYWKVIVACILSEFREENAANIHDLEIRQQRKFYLNRNGEIFTMNFLIFAVAFVLIDELDDNQICIKYFEIVLDRLVGITEQGNSNQRIPTFGYSYGST